MTLNEKIKWIIDNRKLLFNDNIYLRVVDNIDKLDAWKHKRDYLLIDSDRGAGSQECNVIFIHGGVWQYHYTNVRPDLRKYIPLERYLDIIIWLMKRYSP